MIRAAVFDLGGVLEIVDDDTWPDVWKTRWGGFDVLRPADREQAMAEFWDAYCGTLDVRLAEFVGSLRPALTVAVLSNSAPGARAEEERRFGFSELFDVFVYSDEVGLQKPDAAIYEHTRALLGVEPHEIVFLDDRQAAVDGARAAGWHAVLHVNTAASIAELTRIIRRPSSR